LHTPRDYAAVFALRQVIRTTCFDLLRGNPSESPANGPLIALPRLGLVIPKRLVRRAVLRNVIKRQAREAFRHQGTALPGVDLVVRLARWPKETAVLAEDPPALKRWLRREMELLLEKLKQKASSGNGDTR
jgi:ribonuclease P protein component